MDDIHLSREILRAVENGKLPKGVLEELTTEHLLNRCPHCRSEVEAFEAERRAGGGASRAFQALSALLTSFLSRGSREIRGAQRDLADLLRLSPAERMRKVEAARSRFRSPALVRLLLEESRQRIPARPGEAFELAELGWRILNWNPRMPAFYDLYVLLMAQMANAARAGGDLRKADDLFSLVRWVIAEHGVTDPEVVARVDDLMGSLRKDQRRFPEAERLLKRAAMQFGLIDAADDAARVLLNLGAVFSHQGRFEDAIETTRSALALLGPASDPRLHLCGHYNLALQLKEAGRFEEAADLLEADEPLYRQFPEPWTQLRLLWLRGDIAAGRGDLAVAEQAYLETRDGFIAQGIGYDAAVVTLDLAILYLRQGRRSDVRRLAEEMIPLFKSQDVHREALAALTLFLEAAREDEMTVEMVVEVAGVLRHSEAAHKGTGLEPG